MKLPVISLIGLLLIIAIIWMLLTRMEGGEPVLDMGASFSSINASQTLSLEVSDRGCGLRRIWISLLKDGKDAVLLEEEFPAGSLFSGGSVYRHKIDLLVEPRKLGVSDGEAVFRIVVRDYSWRGWGNGNKTYVEKTVRIDTRPPEVEILSNAHNISQGGAGLLIYKLSETSPSSGVYVGGHFYPGYAGYFEDKNIAMAFFALNYDQGLETEMYVKASDAAGNSVRSGFPHYIRKRNFKADVISITDRFLSAKMPEFTVDVPGDEQPSLVDKYLYVNRELRRDSLQTITGFGSASEGEFFWKGDFLRLPRASRRSGYADHREYRYNGKPIDHQVHQGIDLASVSHSPVPAANGGKVLFAGPIGIYGKTVVIDHGFGLLSTYSHLSGIDAREGQPVSRGEIIGRTGTTGLAGGDHLHFGILIHDTFVNPVEWWDPTWIQNNILMKIDAVRARQP